MRIARKAWPIVGMGTLLLPGALGAAPAAGAPLSGVLATDAAPGRIAAFRNTVAWSRWDEAAGGYRVVVDRGGSIRTLDVPPSSLPLALAAGRGPDGATWLVWSRCAGDEMTGRLSDCDVEGYDLDTRRPQAFPFAARPGVLERAPAIDGDRLLYVTGGTDRGDGAGKPGAIARVHLTTVTGAGDRILDVLPTTTCALSEWEECLAVARAPAQSSAIRGDLVAVTSRVSTAGVDSGVCGLATIRLLDLRNGAVRTLDSSVCGLSGQTFTDATFDGSGLLRWRLACVGDPSACEGPGAGPFRQTARARQRLVQGFASAVDGSAMAGRTPILLTRPPLGAAGCWTPQGSYRCGTVTALAGPSYVDVRPERERLPPPGYLTVAGTRRARVLRPPARMACSRGDTVPRAGATLWAGVSRLGSMGRTNGPAVRVVATSRGRTVEGVVPPARRMGFVGQVTTTLDLGGPAAACGRTWALTYRLPKSRPIRFTTRVGSG